MQNTLFASFLLQLCLATLGWAAPLQAEMVDNTVSYGTGGGIIGLIVLILDIIVFSKSLAAPG